MLSTTHLHPMLVHFPIALVLLGFVSEIASNFVKKEFRLSQFGFYLLILGTLSAIFALLAGVFFTSEMEGAAGNILETHELFAWITLCSLISASVLRFLVEVKYKENPGLKKAALILFGVSAIAVLVTGFYGGTLVYEYMMPI